MFLVSICRRGIVGSTVELRHLRYFVAVAEAENVLRAATQKLHVSQPAVSRQIRNLEEELDVQLFQRTGKAVNLTDAGRVFLREARAVRLEQTKQCGPSAISRKPVKQSYTLVTRRHQADTSCQQPCALFKRQCLTFT